MAYPMNFLRLVAIGTLYNAETFSWSISLSPEDSSADAPAAVPAGVISAITAFHTSNLVALGSGARLTMVKLNEIGRDGRYVSQGDTVWHEFATPVAGIGTTNHPAQCSLAVTLRTDAARGRASSGRFYIPYIGATLQADGRLAVAAATDVANAATTMLEALETALPGWAVSVMSNIGEGTRRRVSHVEVGRVVDTIRSRRTSLEEDRQAGPDLSGWTGGGGPF